MTTRHLGWAAYGERGSASTRVEGGARLADQLRDLDGLAVRFARAYASGEEADPHDLAAAIGAAQALLGATTDALGAVLDARQELRAALVLPEGADAAFEETARKEFSRRFGPRNGVPTTE